MTKLWLVSPLGILFAWSGAWTCVPVTLPDGGTSQFNPNPGGGGSGTQGGEVSGVIVVYSPDSGSQVGLMPGPDGGVTVGPGASFGSDFVYMSNSADGTISRVSIPAVGAPYEQARYNCLQPLDNHGVNQSAIWQQNGWNQLMNAGIAAGGINSPSRTLIDRSGNVWVALRAPGYQAGITQIANVTDNLAACTPRCAKRALLAANQSFTEGVPLTLSAGGTVTLSPPTVIAPGTSYATTYKCQDGVAGHDQTGTVITDPVNYDDCILMSIPLGDPTPDPLADPDGLTKGTSFGRAAAMSPNCNPATEQCDVYLGMWNGSSLVHLGFSSPYGATGAPFDVAAVINTGADPYGITVDCAGIAWEGSVAVGALAAVTTVTLNDPANNLNVPPDTIISPWQPNFGGYGGSAPCPGSQAAKTPASHPAVPFCSGAYVVPNSSSCGQYGISSDINDNIWIGSYGGRANTMCSFDANALLTNLAGFQAGTTTLAALNTDLQAGWKSYDLSAQYKGGNGRGINTDKFGAVYEAFDEGPSTGIGVNPNVAGPSPCNDTANTCAAVPCGSPNVGGAACPSGTYTWQNPALGGGGGCGSIGLDLDANNNVWIGNYCYQASQFNWGTGALMNTVGIGYGVYSYSDFSGYALRNITLTAGLYSQVFNGCGSSPEFTQWQTLAYDITTPTGTDAEIEVLPTNTLNPTILDSETPITVCESVVNGNCTGVAPAQTCTPCGNPINLAPYNIPGSQYLVVDVVLFPKICSQEGGATASAKPVLYSLNITEFCPGN